MLFFKIVTAVCAIGLGIFIKHSFYKKIGEMRSSDEKSNRTIAITIGIVSAAVCLFFAVKVLIALATR